MPIPTIHQERLRDKTRLFLKVNYVSSVLAILFSGVCLFALKITEIIPYVFLGFGVLNLINIQIFRYHKSLTLTYNISSIMALASTLTITLYSGGINSPFIFILALIVFSGYVTTRNYGQVYLNLIFFLIILVYSQSIPKFSFTYNVIDPKYQSLFGLFSVLFAVYLLGNVFGKNLLRTHHRLYRSKSELQKKVDEKETLLREVHHRVKNNLQTVSSLLSLQSRNTRDEEMKNAIKSSQNRVVSMAMVHEMLYMRDDHSKIECKSYVRELSEYLLRSLKGPKNTIALDLDIPDIKMGIDTAIPLGLLINEAITNSLKYGFSDESGGKISIAMHQEDSANYLLEIGDNGIGFPEEIDHKTTKSLGLKLMHNLARQLRGSINRDPNKKGTHYLVKFQELSHNSDPLA